jgi:hypothetical protein
MRMPTMDLAPDPSFGDLEQTANLLASGFESLLLEVGRLAQRERYLKSRLDYAHDEVCGLPPQPNFPIYDEKSKLALDQELPFRWR